jgi:hypothetical protein
MYRARPPAIRGRRLLRTGTRPSSTVEATRQEDSGVAAMMAGSGVAEDAEAKGAGSEAGSGEASVATPVTNVTLYFFFSCAFTFFCVQDKNYASLVSSFSVLFFRRLSFVYFFVCLVQEKIKLEYCRMSCYYIVLNSSYLNAKYYSLDTVVI